MLLDTPAGDELRLWDTPGFGDSARLVQRLRGADNPIGWLLREIWDRHRDRPFWCSQQAVRAARASADVVLYLVNAAERPGDAGYLAAEMQVLRWIDKPVLALLNQMGPPRPNAEDLAEQELWRSHLAAHGLDCKVLTLDAFARCWVQEDALLDAVGRSLDNAKQAGFDRLRRAWATRSLKRFDASMELLAEQLAAAAQDAELVDDATLSAGSRALVSLGLRRDDGANRRAMEQLAQRLDARVRSATEQIITLHGLEGSATETILRRVQQTYTTQAPLDEGRAALFGGVLSGALAGLKADLATGGLSMGAGALIGAVLGGLGGAGIARGINRLTGTEQARLSWPDEFLDGLTCAAVLRYLAIAHYGRGRGRFIEGESPAFWYEAVQAALRPRSEVLHRLWKEARDSAGAVTCVPALRGELRGVTAEVLLQLYPAAANIFQESATQPYASTRAREVSR